MVLLSYMGREMGAALCQFPDWPKALQKRKNPKRERVVTRPGFGVRKTELCKKPGSVPG